MNFYIYYHKGSRNIYRIVDKQGALSHLTSANSQLASINTLGGGCDSNARIVDTSSIQSVKISTINAIQAL
jgi:hypothetical protein